MEGLGIVSSVKFGEVFPLLISVALGEVDSVLFKWMNDVQTALDKIVN